MHSFTALLGLAALATALPAPAPSPKIPFVTTTEVIPLSSVPAAKRQAQACFVVGTETLPEEVADVADSLASSITCSASATTLSGVPDVSAASGLSFSSIDFSQSSSDSPLAFALDKFATADPLADSDLQTFQDSLDVYLATEAGVRSVGGDLAIKVPKFFLEMQVSRIQTAQGDAPTAAGLQVDHLRDKVLKNAGGEDQALLDQVTALATQLA